MNSREKILNDIRTAIKTPSHVADDPKDVDTIIRDRIDQLTPKSIDGLVEQFKKELEIVSGEFFEATSQKDAVGFIENILAQNGETQISCAGAGVAEKIAVQLNSTITVVHPAKLEKDKISTMAQINTAIVDVEYGIAESATLVIPFAKTNSTLPHFLPDTVIALLRKDQLVATQFDLFDTLDKELARNMLMVTGPSRTADIEKILILGAHGPRRLFVVLLHESAT